MGAKIYFTSRVDGLVRLFIGLPLMLAVMFLSGGIIQELLSISGADVDPDIRDWSTFIGGVVIGYFVFTQYALPRLETLISYIHLRLLLRADISWRDARRLAGLFMPDQDGVWYPLNQVKRLPAALRKQYIFEFAKRLGRLDWV